MRTGWIVTLAAVLAASPSTAQWAQAPRAAAGWADTAPRRAATPEVGKLALARYHGGGYWWPAMVTEVRGNLVTVQYSGGDKESLPAALIAPLTWRRGSTIECKAASTPYAPMTITAIDPATWAVETVGNDGKPHKTSLRYCRAKARAT